MTTFKQLYVELLIDRRYAIIKELELSSLEIYPTGFVTKSLIVCNFCKVAEEAGGEPKGLKTSIAKLLLSGVTEEQLTPFASVVSGI